MPKEQLLTRLYFTPALYEAARIIGYGGIAPFDFWDAAKKLPFKQNELMDAVYELTRSDQRECGSPRYELTAEARKACMQLLGPAPEHPLADFIRHGPPDVMGEENARQCQEEYRKRKQAEAEAQTTEGDGKAQPKKRGRKSRGR